MEKNRCICVAEMAGSFILTVYSVAVEMTLLLTGKIDQQVRYAMALATYAE